ncbi:hypothetical protein F5J12DRAFT_858454 [Pisolithus orientalis]|uniref:uncharacterized protein n=1 Tax=Pisolithus orientalis TaxID=936130 RepID=UPI002225B10E|nr:uncharacterized protein F5J12DRAFT_858454 [Pisolithus orientalis]KAI5993705.1 hypothetical protein F5J12DRAFT_858454 [Pisolithus orientalis]
MDDLLHTQHRKTQPLRKSIGKHPLPTDSPTYDASEEDNDPLTDDGGSAKSAPVSARSNRPTPLHSKSGAARAGGRHQLASSMLSDDGIDSQTYDGDVESSITARAGHHGHPGLRHSSSTSTLTSQIDDSRVHSAVPQLSIQEPAPFNTASLTPHDIQSFVRRAIEGEPGRLYRINPPPTDRPVRIYADGVYDLFHFGHALQLRQAKLSFPNVYLLVGVSSDEDVRHHKCRSVMSYTERCEAVRHCRWVDEVVADAPWILDPAFLEKWKIDYVAHDEQPYGAEGHDDVYAFVKQQGKFLPTRRTPGVSTSDLLARIVSGYRNRDFDEKLEKMGHSELKAEGCDFECNSQSE